MYAIIKYMSPIIIINFLDQRFSKYEKKILKAIFVLSFFLILTTLFKIGIDLNWLDVKDNNEKISIINNKINVEQKEKFGDINWVEMEIKGNIKTPGIYKVDENTTILQLIKYAGGFKEFSLNFLLNIYKYIKIEDRRITIYFP